MKKYILFFLLLAGCNRQPIMEPEVPQVTQPVQEETPSPCWEAVKEKSSDAWDSTKEKLDSLKEYLRQELHEATTPEDKPKS